MILNDSLMQNGSILLNNGSLNLTVNIIAENLTGDGKLISDSSIWSYVLNPFSAISLVISIITLWLSHLRGARISLVEKPKIELNDSRDEVFKPDDIPQDLTIKEVDLFFINSGNKAGFVMDIQAIILLEDNAKKCLEPFKITNEKWLIIPEKSGGKVVIPHLGFQIKGLPKGRGFKKFESIEESENLDEIITAIFYKQRRDLEQFIELIRNKKTFADLEISYKYSGGKNWISGGIKENKFKLTIENQYESTIEEYQKYLNKYNKLRPTINDVKSKIGFYISECQKIIKTNKNGLLEMKEPQSLPNPSYKEILSNLSFECNLLDKWKKSKTCAEELKKLFYFMDNYTKIYNRASMSGMIVDMEECNKCKNELIEKFNKIIPELEHLVKELETVPQ